MTTASVKLVVVAGPLVIVVAAGAVVLIVGARRVSSLEHDSYKCDDLGGSSS